MGKTDWNGILQEKIVSRIIYFTEDTVNTPSCSTYLAIIRACLSCVAVQCLMELNWHKAFLSDTEYFPVLKQHTPSTESRFWSPWLYCVRITVIETHTCNTTKETFFLDFLIFNLNFLVSLTYVVASVQSSFFFL